MFSFLPQRHHFAQTVCILNSEGCNIFKNLTAKVWCFYLHFELMQSCVGPSAFTLLTNISTRSEYASFRTSNLQGATIRPIWWNRELTLKCKFKCYLNPWITHWALALVKGIREPHEVKKKSFDLGGNRTHDLRIRSTVTLPAELRGRTEKVGDD